MKANTHERRKLLKVLLTTKKITEKELKIEVLLMLCEHLISSYIDSELSGKSTKVIDNHFKDEMSIINDENEKSKICIFDEMTIMNKYLLENILTLDKLEKILSTAKIRNQYPIQVKMLDPYLFYYNNMIGILKSEISKIEFESGKKVWIPDLIALQLIDFFKVEKGYSFAKYPYINEYNFSDIFSIYNKTNLRLKKHKILKENLDLKISQVDTLITRMESIVSKIANKLDSLRYVA